MNAPQKPVLNIRVSKRDLDAHKPGHAWQLERYIPWFRKQAESRSIERILFILSAKNCSGCSKLKSQLNQLEDHLRSVLVIYAEAGDLYNICYFGIRLGGLEIHAPGVPTGYLISIKKPETEILSISLGPLDDGDEIQQLDSFLSGESRSCWEAKDAKLTLVKHEKKLQFSTQDLNLKNDFFR